MEKQLTAAQEMIAALEIKQGQEALVAMVLGLAEAVDEDTANAALWRELRAAVTTLREATSDTDDDDTTAFILSIKTPRVRPTLGHSSES